MVRDEVSHSVRNDMVGLMCCRKGGAWVLLDEILRYAQNDKASLVLAFGLEHSR